MPSSECQICFTNYDTGQHKIMNGSCGHSLCLECCSHLVEATCPFCKRTRSFSNAAPNYLAMEMLTTSPTCSNTVNASPLTQETVDEIITQVTKALIGRTDASVHRNKDRPMHAHGSNSRNTHTGNIEGALEKQQIREEENRRQEEKEEKREENEDMLKARLTYNTTPSAPPLSEEDSERRKEKEGRMRWEEEELRRVEEEDLKRAVDESQRMWEQREREEKERQRKEEEERRRAEDESRRLLQQRERLEKESQREKEERRRERLATTILAVVSAIFLVASISDLTVGFTSGSADYSSGKNVTHLVACIVDIGLYLFLLPAALIRKSEIESQTTRQYTRVGKAAQAGRLSWDITNVGVFFIVANNIFTFFLIIFWIFNGFSWPITIDFISRGVLFPFIFVIGIGISVCIYISDTINGKKLQPGIWFIVPSAIFLAVSISDLIVGFTSGSADYSSGKNVVPLVACMVDILVYLFLIIALLLREKVLQYVGLFLVPANIVLTVIFWCNCSGYSCSMTIDFISRGVVLAVSVTMLLCLCCICANGK